MQKRDFETYQKHFWDFEILPKFSDTHVFRGTIRHPYCFPMTINIFVFISRYTFVTAKDLTLTRVITKSLYLR